MKGGRGGETKKRFFLLTSGFFCCIFAAEIKNKMAKEYSHKDIENHEVNDPQVQYVASAHRTLRTISEEEMERSMTLEELDNHLTELIHQHYHAK